jgi:hypothetical protein
LSLKKFSFLKLNIEKGGEDIVNPLGFYKSTDFKSVAFTIPSYPLGLAKYIKLFYKIQHKLAMFYPDPGEHKSEARPFALKRVFININFIIGPTPGVWSQKAKLFE